MTLRRILFWTHLVAGLAAGSVILFMALTGILMSFEPQIVAWAERDLQTVGIPASGTGRLSLDTLLAKAEKVTPKGRPNTVTLRADPGASVMVSFGKEGGSAYFHPYSGVLLGRESRTHVFLHQVEDLHRWLGSRKIGKPVTGAACLVFFFLLISGLFLWWPRRWNRAALRSATIPNWKLKGRARDWNWHNTAGLWAAPLLLITTSTGIIISYRWANDLLFTLTGNAPPPRPPEEKAKSKGERMPRGEAGLGEGAGKANRDPFGVAPRASLDTLLARAEEKIPVWASIQLRLPPKPGAPVTLSIIEPGFTRRMARSQLTLNAATAEQVKWEPYAEQNLGRRLRSWVVPLHTGRAGGVVGQGLALLSACAAALLIYTGAAMAWRRFFGSSNRSAI